MLSFSSKERGKRPVTWALPDFSLYKNSPFSDKVLVEALWHVLDGADLIVGHNIDKFDLKRINAQFLLHGLTPPSPYKTVDTLKLIKKVFAFNSNKLDDLCKALGIGQKVKHYGFELWLGCMRGDPKSWALLKKYNAKDVILSEKFYDRIRAWDDTHPNITLDTNQSLRCPVCGSKTQKRGFKNLKTYRLRQYWCINPKCHKYSTGERERLTAKVLS